MLLISIDGFVGAGKTTFIELIKLKANEYAFVEDLEAYNKDDLIERSYTEDVEEELQKRIFEINLKRLKSIPKDAEVVYYERSLYSSKWIFSYDENGEMLDIVKPWFKTRLPELPEHVRNAKFVIVMLNPMSKMEERILTRGRNFEVKNMERCKLIQKRYNNLHYINDPDWPFFINWIFIDNSNITVQESIDLFLNKLKILNIK